MARAMIAVANGSTRIVICIHRWAFKIPRPRAMFEFTRAGLLGNQQEVERFERYGEQLNLAPCRAVLPFGLLTVMDRCDPVSHEEAATFTDRPDGVLDHTDADWFVNDRMARNLGRLPDGRLVKLDYADIGTSTDRPREPKT